MRATRGWVRGAHGWRPDPRRAADGTHDARTSSTVSRSKPTSMAVITPSVSFSRAALWTGKLLPSSSGARVGRQLEGPQPMAGRGGAVCACERRGSTRVGGPGRWYGKLLRAARGLRVADGALQPTAMLLAVPCSLRAANAAQVRGGGCGRRVRWLHCRVRATARLGRLGVAS